MALGRVGGSEDEMTETPRPDIDAIEARAVASADLSLLPSDLRRYCAECGGRGGVYQGPTQQGQLTPCDVCTDIAVAYREGHKDIPALIAYVRHLEGEVHELTRDALERMNEIAHMRYCQRAGTEGEFPK